MRVFFSYTSDDATVVGRVRLFTKRSFTKVFAFAEDQSASQGIQETIEQQLADTEALVVFVGARLGSYQLDELRVFRGWLLKRRPVKRPDGSEVDRKLVFVCLCRPDRVGQLFGPGGELQSYGNDLRLEEPVEDEGPTDGVALRIANWLTRVLHVPWRSFDDLPLDPHLFSYEKDIIQSFHNVRRIYPHGKIEPTQAVLRPGCEEDDRQVAATIKERWLDGCPVEWPKVPQLRNDRYPNQLPENEIGKRRPPEAAVIVRALTEHGSAATGEFSFPEAGPREALQFPVLGAGLKVGILVSGGIAPGVNAVIDGIVQRHWQYAERQGYQSALDIYGFQDGFLSFKYAHSYVMLAANSKHDRRDWGARVIQTREHAHEGGSVIGTSRVDALLDSPDRSERLEKIAEQLRLLETDILYVIGGDGTMKAAHALYTVSQGTSPQGKPLSVVAIPKTMDNDILWVWQPLGFLSAVEKAREVIEHLSTEVRSNPRIYVVQLFGSDSGFVVSHAVLASATGHCVAALIPEVPFSMNGLIAHLQKAVCPTGHRPPHGIVVMAETAIPTDAMDYVEPRNELYDVGLSPKEKEQIIAFDQTRSRGQRIQGQTDDLLRSAGLKIVSRGLEKRLAPRGQGDKPWPGWELLRVVANEPRHLLRAIPPSCLDIIIGQRLGTLAVDNALAGFTDFMISQWLTEYVLVPLKLVVLGRKRIPESGIFWKSVLAKTGQPADMQEVAPLGGQRVVAGA